MKRRTVSIIFIVLGAVLFLFSFLFSATLVEIPPHERVDSRETVYSMNLSSSAVVTVIDVSGHFGLVPSSELTDVNCSNLASLSVKPYNVTGVDDFNVTYTGLSGAFSFVYFNQTQEKILVIMEKNGITASLSSILVFTGIALVITGAALVPTFMKKK